ncbi:MAG: hypothetical protein ACE5KK_07965 [Candidatus Brocadiales bacterium]
MRTSSLLVLVALLIGFPSCGGVKDSYRRSSYIGDNPELTSLQRNDIRKGRLQAGMTREMVRASLGEPTETSAKTTLTGTLKERWFYDKDDETLTIKFQDSRVVGWTQEKKEAEK